MEHFGALIRRFAETAQALAEQMGGPGLLLVAFIDSSVFTLPEVADFLVAVFAIQDPDRWLYYAAMTTAGSVAGCHALYALARAGGRALVRRGFHERHIDRVLDWCRRHGALVLIVPALLPPPMPFKLFVVMAGVAGIRPAAFLAAVTVGRGVRYGAEAWLAKHYGAEALRVVQQDGLSLLWPFTALLVVAGGLWWLWRQRQAAGGTPPHPPASS